MCTNAKVKQTFLKHLPVPVRYVVKSLQVIIQVSMLETHAHADSYKPVVQAWHDFIILMHTSKGEQINFKFLFVQFRLVR